jgi:hypothetical protein
MEVAMRHHRICLWAIAVLYTLVPFGCAKKTPERIDAGSFEGSVYSNKYLGFTLTIPPNWSIQDQQTQKQLLHTGVEVMAGDNKNMQAVLRASEVQAVSLLTVFKYARGAPVPSNPAIVGTAESVSHLPGMRTGGDYLFQARRLLEAGQLKHSFPREVYVQTVGGVEFHVMPTEVTLSPQMVVKQEYYATIRKGYAIVLILSFSTEEEGNELRHTLGTITFAPLE